MAETPLTPFGERAYVAVPNVCPSDGRRLSSGGAHPGGVLSLAATRKRFKNKHGPFITAQEAVKDSDQEPKLTPLNCSF